MRPVPVILLSLLLAGGLAWVLLREKTPRRAPPAPSRDDLARVQEEDPHLLLQTGTLVIRVRAPDGSVPEGAEVGYVHDGYRRTVYAGEDGRRPFADAPLGTLEVFGHAPGYPEVTQTRVLIPGVREEIVLELVPEGS